MELSEIAKTEGYSKYKRVTTTTASTYYVLVTDYLINPVANTNDITYILPPKTSFSGGGIQELIIINNVVSGNSITVQCYPGDTFIHGNTKYILPSNMGDIHILLKDDGHLVSDTITATITVNVTGGTISTSLTTIPYDTEVINTQTEFFSFNNSTGEITILTSGLYDIYTNLQVAGAAVAWSVDGDIYQNSGKIDGTYFWVKNFSDESGYASTANSGIELEAGDKITVIAIGVGSITTIHNANLTMVLRLG